MPANENDIIRQLRNNWRRQRWLNHLLRLTGICSICMAVLFHWEVGISWWILATVILLTTSLIQYRWDMKLSDADVARYINTAMPELEESAELLLLPVESLPTLQQLQHRRIETVLPEAKGLRPYARRRRNSLLILPSLLITSVLVILLPRPVSWGGNTSREGSRTALNPPSVARVSIRIEPPSYTKRPAYTQRDWDVLAEDGSMVQWQIGTGHSVANVQLIWNDSLTMNCVRDEQGRQWTTRMTVHRDGLYQLRVDGRESPLYKIAVTADQPPSIQVRSPLPYTVIDYGQQPRIMLQATLSDDYGIKDAYIDATISSGNGEAVKFKEQHLPFPVSFANGEKNYSVFRPIDLAALGMKPGDELYFYITAEDNRRQQSRSDMYMATLADTAELMQIEGMTYGLNIKPEYFRSERQIIMETEQLLKEADTTNVTRFRDKSNSLGIDQKILRLRYGKFLGEEAETNIGDTRMDDPGHAEEKLDEKDFGNAAKIIEAYTDRHDNAEDASFFDAGTKAQLKAILTEMWKAELLLRVFEPRRSLAFEYKALRLLKDLQQSSRAYVSKTSQRTDPLKMEKRLTGDLGKISPRNIIVSLPDTGTAQVTLGRAATLIAQLNGNEGISGASFHYLREALTILKGEAARGAIRDLSVVDALQRMVSAAVTHSPIPESDRALALRGIQSLLSNPVARPAPRTPVQTQLSTQYFLQLHNKSK